VKKWQDTFFSGTSRRTCAPTIIVQAPRLS